MTTDDATREGVSQETSAPAEEQDLAQEGQQPAEPTKPEQPEEPLSEREQAMEEIAARSAVDRGQAREQPEPKGEEPSEQEVKPAEKDEAKPKPAEPAAKAPVALGDDDLVEMKVNGRVTLKPWKEVRAASQKAAAADEKFDKAAQERKSAQQEREEAARLRREAEELSGKREPAPDNGTGDDTDEEFAELVHTVQYGDEHEAAEAMKKILEKGRGGDSATQISEEEITRRVTSAIQQEQAYKSDLNTFATEFEDIATDTRLAQMAAQEVHQVRAEDLLSIGYEPEQVRSMPLGEILQRHRHHQQEGAVRSEIDLFREAGNRTRTWIGGLRGNKPEPAPANTLEEKREFKRSMPSTPPAANNRAPSKPQDKPQTRTEALDEMRKARGQA